MLKKNDISKKHAKADTFTREILKNKFVAMCALIFILLVAFLSAIYLNYAWNRYQNQASSEAIILAQSLEALLPHADITLLSGNAEDLQKPEYRETKLSLTRLVEATNPIRFAYLMGVKDGNLIFLMDSESPDSPDYSPPGQVYKEATNLDWEPFLSGKTVLTGEEIDRWGTWISVLVPVENPANGSVTAIFGIDYSASEWYAQLWSHMIPDIIIVGCMLILSFTLIYGWIQHITNKSLSHKLSYSEALYRSVFEQAPIGIAIGSNEDEMIQPEQDNFTINPMFKRILGRTTQDFTNVKWTEITHPEDLQNDMEKFGLFKKGEIDSYSLEKRYVKPDGSTVLVNTKIAPFLKDPVWGSKHICIVEDISERKAIENALRESERREAVLLSHLPGMAYRCNYDRDWTMQFVSDGCYNLTGYASENIINNRDLAYNDLIAPEYRNVLWNVWERTLSKGLPFKYEYEIITASGTRKWVLEMGQGIYNDEGKIEALEGIVLDISDRKEMENNLRYINEHDRLTGLYNREYLVTLLKNDVKKKKTFNKALIGINLNTVQLLTANYGFHYTQKLIKKVAEILSKYCTDKCILFKTSENRFLFYLKGYKDKSELIEFSKTVADTLECLFVAERIGGGIGIIEIDQNNKLNVDLLLRKLLIASERSTNLFDKDFGAFFYDKDLEAIEEREREIRQELTTITVKDNSDRLFLQYQPILDLQTNSICGFEALARLRTEKLGLISPLEFIPIAEKTKLVIPLGEKVIVNTFRFLNRLKEQGYNTINVSFNVSAIQFLGRDFTGRLFALINKMQINPKNIGIEITESVFSSDYEEINSVISELKDAGIHIAIDDFGTGYSSLAREKELDVNSIKIDKFFIDKLLVDGKDNAITGDIISMAHKLGHYAIAEGVEYEEQKQYLLAHGCDMIQGYLVGKPLDEDEALELLSKQSGLDKSCN